MILDNKAKEDFEKWFGKTKYITQIINDYEGDYIIMGIEVFNQLPFSMQYGVLVDWFDSVGIYIEVMLVSELGFFNAINNKSDGIEYFDTRTQATQQAIEKANEVYNNRV